MADQQFDVAIVGAGIAGLTAGLTAARLGRRTLVLTGDVLGGQLLSIEKVDGYPGFPEGVPGYDLCPIAHEQAADAGAEFVTTPPPRSIGSSPAARTGGSRPGRGIFPRARWSWRWDVR
jgi:thioredoxin reductase